MSRILYLFFSIFSWLPLAGQFDIIDFGASPGQLSTEPIQAAIDSAYKQGGGMVMVPAGTFIIGTIELKSNIELHLSPGAILLGSTNLEDYQRSFRRHGMIYCNHAYNVSITGQGTIDANGRQFYDFSKNHRFPEFDRMRVRQRESFMPDDRYYDDGPIKRLAAPGMTLTFYFCTDVVIKDITIKETPVWAVRFAYCEDVLVQGINIYNNLLMPNSDGLHCTCSRNVRISNCHIQAGDDAIIFTGFRLEENVPGISDEEYRDKMYGNKSGYSENIVVTDCDLQSRSAGIRIGYGQQPIRRAIFSNIVIHGSNRGIGIFAHDAADIEDLLFSNIIIETRLHNGQWWGNGEPIHLSAISRFPDQPVGVIKNVHFENIKAIGGQGILVYGHADSPMENISFRNVQLTIVKGKETENFGGNIDLRPAADQNMRLFERDLPGFLAKHINGLDLETVKIVWGPGMPAYYTYALETEQVLGLDVEKFEGIANPASNLSEPFRYFETTFKH